MRVLASAALLLLIALAATGAVEGVVPAADEIAANERAKEAASLEAEVGQLKAKISGLGACAVYIGSRSPRCCSVVSVFRCLCWV
jgi:hypothetical protein